MADRKPKAAEEGAFEKFTKWCVSKFAEYKSEFKKIVWPSPELLAKQTVTVIVISLIFGAYIAILDGGFGFLLTQFGRYFGAV